MHTKNCLTSTNWRTFVLFVRPLKPIVLLLVISPTPGFVRYEMLRSLCYVFSQSNSLLDYHFPAITLKRSCLPSLSSPSGIVILIKIYNNVREFQFESVGAFFSKRERKRSLGKTRALDKDFFPFSYLLSYKFVVLSLTPLLPQFSALSCCGKT